MTALDRIRGGGRPRAALAMLGALAACVPMSVPRVAPLTAAKLDLAPITAAAAVAPRWWTGFGDAQLDRVIGDALANNPDLDVAIARIRQADALLASRRAEDGPQVTFDPMLQVARLPGRYIIPPPYGESVRAIGTIEANLAWNLDFFGRQKAAIVAARASAQAARFDLAAARLALAGSVAQTYLDLARAERQAAIARRTIQTREGSLHLVEVRVRNQLASQLDVAAAQTLLGQAREALAGAEGQRAVAANALAALAGRGPAYAATLGATSVTFDTALPLPATVPADLLARRPDVAAALARVDAATAGRQVARRAFYPNVNLAAFAGLQAIGIGNLFVPASLTAGAGPAIHLPIFESGRLRADLESATGGLDLATAQYNQTVVRAVQDAADAIALVGNLAVRSARQRDVVDGFARTGRLNAIRVSSGLDSRLDLVDNDVRLLDAELTQVNLAADAARERVALAVALGGGFPPEGNR